jgi:hypothetical protein
MNIIVICSTVCVCVFIVSYFTCKSSIACYKSGYHVYQCKHEYKAIDDSSMDME